MQQRRLLVLGAGSSIGRGLLYYAQKQGAAIAGVSRFAAPDDFTPDLWLTLELQQGDAGATLAASLPGLCQQFQPTDIFICHGLLQQDNVKAEKTIRQLDEQAALTSWWVNYLLPALHLQALFAYMQSHACRVLVLSAKVGSISDNELGGWYSYRSAKAALNMLVKTTAIELTRNKSPAVLSALHPGTTTSLLSAPFVRNLPPGQLQTPEQTAQRLWQVASDLQPEQHGKLLHWDGSVLPF
ncbi:short-chain dehydrogenase [Rheinheimera sp.]|uniref:short-chain dehydrogenase n=1 Tax=Rheinheimera sp. TaxID=1869214 RepID=UPI0027B8FAC1|nr:short-chain dehydrogenase [Rheinheimera sp.]